MSKPCALTARMLKDYDRYLRERERAEATVQKYMRDLHALRIFLGGAPLTKNALLAWKGRLVERYAPASVNSMLAAANSFLAFAGRPELAVKPLKVQRSLFLDESRELTRAEYIRLIRTAETQKNERLSLVLQTICATGIRVSKLRLITAEAVQSGRAEIACKGKRRVVFLTGSLRRCLKKYLQKQKKTAGAVFATRTGRSLDRSNIWRDESALRSSGRCAGKGLSA